MHEVKHEPDHYEPTHYEATLSALSGLVPSRSCTAATTVSPSVQPSFRAHLRFSPPMSASSSSAALRVNAVLSHLQLSPVSSSPTSPGGGSSSAPLVSVSSRSGGVAVLVINNPPVNSLHPNVQKALDECYRQCCRDSSLRAVVITGAGSTFMAGADIAHLRQQQRSHAQPADIQQWIRAGDDIFSRLESGPLPTVAAVNGDALGGGCELALACNARLCSDNAAFGLPELSLGIIPGLGGTQRLPRVIGLEKAVTLTLSGKVTQQTHKHTSLARRGRTERCAGTIARLHLIDFICAVPYLCVSCRRS